MYIENRLVGRMEVHYRWQITKWESLEMLGQDVFPCIVINDEVLLGDEVTELLSLNSLTFEQFAKLVPDGYLGTTDILKN